jgi:hypothetical protein
MTAIVRISFETWHDGPPPDMPAAAILADLLAYRKLVCAGCGKRGMKVSTQHTESGAYRVLVSCRTCKHVEVV